jgi:hypothetical protein
VGSADGRTFVLEFKELLEGEIWTPISTNNGVTVFIDSTPATNVSRFYRLRAQ